jgi:hypothetical protein
MRSGHLRENFTVFQGQSLAIASVLSMGIQWVRILHPSLINPRLALRTLSENCTFRNSLPAQEQGPSPLLTLPRSLIAISALTAEWGKGISLLCQDDQAAAALAQRQASSA